MRALLQRVGHSEVQVEGKIVGEIQRGLLVYVGISTTDTQSDAVKLAGKVAELRAMLGGDIEWVGLGEFADVVEVKDRLKDLFSWEKVAENLPMVIGIGIGLIVRVSYDTLIKVIDSFLIIPT